MAKISANFICNAADVDAAHVEAKARIDTYLRTIRNNYSPHTRIEVRLDEERGLECVDNSGPDGNCTYMCNLIVAGWFEPDAFVLLGFDFDCGL